MGQKNSPGPGDAVHVACQTDPASYDHGLRHLEGPVGAMTATDIDDRIVLATSSDGVTWDAPRQIGLPVEYLWWVRTHGDAVYGASRLMRRRIENGEQVGEDESTFVVR